MIRACFVNSGMLGHRAVAVLLRDASAEMPSVSARHIDLSADLTIADRVARRLLSVPLAPTGGSLANLDLRRWRQEWNAGLLAARRLTMLERAGAAFDVVHFHTQATAYASLARLSRMPSIVSIDTTQRLASLEAPSRLARWTYAPNIAHDGAVFRAATAIVATSRWAATDLASVYPDCAEKVHVMPYPIKASGFSDAWLREREARARTRPRPRTRVLFVGGDFPRKGGFDLLAAWREGGFADRADLDLVTDWALGDLPPGVRRLGGVVPYTTTWYELWRSADLFVMPTRHESFGMVFQEAGAAGLPTVATAINAIPEIVQDHGTGLLVRPDDPRGLVAAMGALIDDPDRRLRLGRAARAHLLDVAAPSAYVTRLATLLQEAVRRHGTSQA